MLRPNVHRKVILLSITAILLTANLADANNEFNKRDFLLESLKHHQLTFGSTDDPPPQPAIAVAEWEPATSGWRDPTRCWIGARSEAGSATETSSPSRSAPTHAITRPAST